MSCEIHTHLGFFILLFILLCSVSKSLGEGEGVSWEIIHGQTIVIGPIAYTWLLSLSFFITMNYNTLCRNIACDFRVTHVWNAFPSLNFRLVCVFFFWIFFMSDDKKWLLSWNEGVHREGTVLDIRYRANYVGINDNFVVNRELGRKNNTEKRNPLNHRINSYRKLAIRWLEALLKTGPRLIRRFERKTNRFNFVEVIYRKCNSYNSS